MIEELQQIPNKISLEQLDVSGLSKDKIRDLFRTGKLPTAEGLVDEIILRSIKEGANDIHFEVGEVELRIRIGQGGIFKKLVYLPKDITENVINVVKTKAGMNVFEKKKPQDGRFSQTFGNHQFDFRASTVPAMFGERIALRILHKTARVSSLEELGFSTENFEKFRLLLKRPNGLLLVTGPSGSGKSTTVYAAVHSLQSSEKNILTVENPIEYKLDFASQIQAYPEQSFTYTDALRAILRQNPNVIMIGEIREPDTAMIAAEAALTGNLVLSTMLSGDAIGTIPRLLNLGISPFWLASTLIGVIYQILVRKICEVCKEETAETTEKHAPFFKLLSGQKAFYRGRGCDVCQQSGYKGRVALQEILVIDDRMKDAIYQQVTLLKMKEIAIASGFDNIYHDAVSKVSAGITTIAECARVLG